MDQAIVVVIAVITTAVLVTEKHTGRKQVNPADVKVPEYVKVDLLTPNKYSRPQTPLEKVNGIVVHYVANPCSTALENRNYFEGLKDQTGSKTTSSSGIHCTTSPSSPITKWLLADIIRHYDVTGKICPKYFVDHPEEWETFHKDVKNAIRILKK